MLSPQLLQCAHKPHCTFAIQCYNVENLLTSIMHVPVFTGNISGDIIDELMSSDGKYLVSILEAIKKVVACLLYEQHS